MKFHSTIQTWLLAMMVTLVTACNAISQEDESTAELMEQAQAAAVEGDMDKAITLIEKAIEQDEENFQLKLMLASALQQHGMQTVSEDRDRSNKLFLRSAKIAREVMNNEEATEQFGDQLNPFFASIIYNEACTLALEEKTNQAMESLKKAFELGFKDYELAATDADLSSLFKGDEQKNFVAEQKVLATKRLFENFESFDFDFELNDLEGETVKLSDYQGKVLIVDFWGTWCPPCRAEIPSFVKLKNKYGDQGFDVVGITNEQTEDVEEAVSNVKEFMKNTEINYTCVISDDETEDQVNLTAFPTTLFIDESGKVRLKLVGFHDYETLESIIQELLKEKG